MQRSAERDKALLVDSPSLLRATHLHTGVFRFGHLYENLEDCSPQFFQFEPSCTRVGGTSAPRLQHSSSSVSRLAQHFSRFKKAFRILFNQDRLLGFERALNTPLLFNPTRKLVKGYQGLRYVVLMLAR